MPNGEFVGQIPIPVPDAELDIPGVPKEATSFQALTETTVDFFAGLFEGGPPAFEKGPIADLAAISRSGGPTILQQLGIVPLDVATTTSPITGREAIPTPEEGGPPLVTERFRNLPPIPDVPELLEGPLGFEGITNMPVDVPLLAGFQSLLPAIRGVVQPSIQGVVGGLAGGFLSEFLRPIQETGLGTVPMRQVSPGQISPGGCPPEKPHTRILRFIKQNTGVAINLSRAKSLIRELGLENAARCLGVNAQEVCSLLIVASPRRRRGISASDIRIVKRTARRFENLKHDLGHLGGRGHASHKRRHHHGRHAHK